MNFNLEQVPFSRCGSYMAFSWLSERFRGVNAKEGLYLRTVHGDAVSKDIMLVELTDGGRPIPFEIKAMPELLRLEAADGYVEICIATSTVIRIRGCGVGLRFSSSEESMFNNAIPFKEYQWIINAFNSRVQLMFIPLKARLCMDAPWDGSKCSFVKVDILPDDTGYFECAIEEFYSSWYQHIYDDFDESVKSVKEEFKAFLGKMPDVSDEFSQAAELAAYIDWSCIVEPNGLITRPAMFMSKNWMTNVWSWDHCFNAIALSYKYPELAWDQFMIMFDHQDNNGALPDSINDRLPIWNFCKPPIHGWALKKMMDNTDYIDRAKLVQVYEPLCDWTNWWFNYRDDDDDGIPQYNHGNDSGWDNSTVFAEKPPIESPDLAAFLIIQMETLSNVADKLGRKAQSRVWKQGASELLNRLLEHSLRGNRLVALQSETHKPISSQSLLPFMPIILAGRLPQNVLTATITDLKQSGIITEHGLATESIDSPLYEADGYWRGPIWAPSTMLMVDGLKEAGEEAMAQDICRKFACMCAAGGFAENFDALTGKGLRDKAYTWTSSVFLVLAHEYLL